MPVVEPTNQSGRQATDYPVQMKGIVNRFGTHTVHEHIDLDVKPNEILSIIGGSGSGKTVLLNCMIGLRQPTSGTVRLLDVDLKSAPDEDLHLLRNRVGVVFQAGGLFSAYTVEQNVAFPINELHSLSPELVRDLTRLKIDMVGLQQRDATKLPAELSGGMRTRAALARALALDPSILFLDEPTAGLDPVSTELFVELIQDLHQSLGLTVVMVTHDLHTLTALSDRIAVLADQGIVALGEPDAVIDDPHPFIRSYFRTLRPAWPPAHPATPGGRH